jgi:hypothetical protein
MQVVDLALGKDGIEGLKNPAVWGFDMEKLPGCEGV